MSKKKKGGEEHEEELGEGWLLPYADLLTLLLALFIVLFASSQIDQEKFAAMASAFSSEYFGGATVAGIGDFSAGIVEEWPPQMSIPQPFPEYPEEEELEDKFETGELDNLKDLMAQLEKDFSENGLEGSVAMYIDERGLVVSLRNAVMFDSGSAFIRQEYRAALAQIAISINKLENHIRVEGHTDNVPMRDNPVNPTNWELSTNRAAAVVRLFIDQGGIESKKLMSCGYADSRPIAENDTVEGRAQNRRVDIIVLNTRYNALEEQSKANG